MTDPSEPIIEPRPCMLPHNRAPFDLARYVSAPRSTSFFVRHFPALAFYSWMFGTVLHASRMARRGLYTDARWLASSRRCLEIIEDIGARVEIENIASFSRLDTPCVFVGNHMSTLETFLLPGIIREHMPVTFVVKQSLIDYPIFGHVMRSRNPVVVTRDNPREDLRVVMEEGARRLADGVSIVIFPQTTRMRQLDPAQFNTIGVKLARRAGVPVIPTALKTDAWGTGRLVKDIGRIDASRDVHIRFGQPMEVTGNGRSEHEAVVRFIEESLREWGIS